MTWPAPPTRKAKPDKSRVIPLAQLENGKFQTALEVYDKQVAYISSNSWLSGFVAGRGAGKSVSGALKVLNSAKAGWPIMAVSPTYNMAADTTFPTFVEIARSVGKLIRTTTSPYPRAYFRTLDGGRAVIDFRSGEEPDKLRGPSRPMLWIDEASVCHEDVFSIGVPMLRYKGIMGTCLLTFTPKGRTHWTFKKFFESVPSNMLPQTPNAVQFGNSFYRQLPNTMLVQAHSRENPFVADEFVDLIGGVFTQALREQELGGKFVDIAGLLFSRENFMPVREWDIPRQALRVRYWDRAASVSKTSSFTSGVRMCMPLDGKPFRWILEDVVRGQWHPTERDKKIRETAEKDAKLFGNEVLIYIEQEGGSGGKEVAQLDVAKLAGFPVFIDQVSGTRTRKKDGQDLPGPGKVVRAMAYAAQVEAGNVGILEGARWIDDYLDEATAFPESTWSDQIDSSSGAFNKLSMQGTNYLEPASTVTPGGLGTKLLEMQAALKLNRKKLF